MISVCFSKAELVYTYEYALQMLGTIFTDARVIDDKN